MTPSIAEDIQMLVNLVLHPDESDINDFNNCVISAQRVEVYLSTFKPDYL